MKSFISRALVLSILVCLPGLPAVQAAEQAGMLLSAYGNVKATGADGVDRELKRRSAVFAGDLILTGSGSSAQVKFSDGAIVAVKPGTRLKIDDYRYQSGASGNTSVMSLLQGGFRTISGAIARSDRSAYKVNTPVATIGIRGTFYETQYSDGKGLGLGVWDGGIEACNDSGCLDLGSGAAFNFGTVPPGGGEPQGSDTPPPGIGDGMPVTGDQGPGDADFGTFAIEETLIDQEQGDFLLNDGLLTTTNVFERNLLENDLALYVTPRFKAYLSYWSSPSDPALGWVSPGHVRTLSGPGDIGYTIDPVAGLFVSGPWAMASGDVPGAVLIEEIPCDCSVTGQQYADGAMAFYGDWYTASSTYPITSTPEVLSGQGQFVMGDVAPLSAVLGMSGTVFFSAYFVGGSDTVEGPRSINLNTSIDFSTNTASGLLQTSFGTGQWNIGLDGSLTGSGVAMSANGQSTYDNSSLGITGAAVVGNLEAVLVGKTTVDAMMGSFDFQAVAANPQNPTIPIALGGTFILDVGMAP
ncbi:MAG: FecR family protein [Pseudomonadota bacterium]